MSVLMAGAGMPRGQVVGATDAKGLLRGGETCIGPRILPLRCTQRWVSIRRKDAAHDDGAGRVQLVSNGRLIKELFA